MTACDVVFRNFNLLYGGFKCSSYLPHLPAFMWNTDAEWSKTGTKSNQFNNFELPLHKNNITKV